MLTYWNIAIWPLRTAMLEHLAEASDQPLVDGKASALQQHPPQQCTASSEAEPGGHRKGNGAGSSRSLRSASTDSRTTQKGQRQVDRTSRLLRNRARTIAPP